MAKAQPQRDHPKNDKGWSGGAMVLGKLPVPGRPAGGGVGGGC